MKAAVKKTLVSLMVVSVLFGIFSGGITMGEGRDELMIFAAASLTESLEEAAELFRESNPDTDIIFNFDSSGTLKKQIEEGAECDIFISASPKQADELETGGFVMEGTRLDLLKNTIVLVMAEKELPDIKSFDDFAELFRSEVKNGDFLLAIGNSDVPAGAYALKIFGYYDIDEKRLSAEGLITYASNVKEVTTQVSEAAADFGIVYSTDAYSAGLKVAGIASEKMCGAVIYPAVVMADTKNREKALSFLDFLQKEEAAEIFEAAGFVNVTEKDGK